MAYPLRFDTNYSTYAVKQGNDAAKGISYVSADGSAMYHLQNDTRYSYYRQRYLTLVNLTTQPFISNSSVGIIVGYGYTGSTHTMYYRVSSDNTNWSSWRSVVLTRDSSAYVRYLFTWTENNIYYIQFYSYDNFSYSSNTNAQYCHYFYVDSNYLCALEGNLDTIWGNNTSTTGITMSSPCSFRSMFRSTTLSYGSSSFTINSWLLYAHNLVHNCNSASYNQHYTYMFAAQVNLLTAPLYWNASKYGTSYPSTVSQAYRGMFDGCTSLLIGLRNYKNYTTDMAYIYRNCTSLRYIFRWASATSGSNTVLNVPTSSTWTENGVTKNRISKEVYTGSTASYPTVSGWNTEAYYVNTKWGLRVGSTLTTPLEVPSAALSIIAGNY